MLIDYEVDSWKYYFGGLRCGLSIERLSQSKVIKKGHPSSLLWDLLFPVPPLTQHLPPASGPQGPVYPSLSTLLPLPLQTSPQEGFTTLVPH